MKIDERTRHDIHTGLAEAIGEGRASALMEMLPPTGWADVATKRDLDSLAALTRHDMDQHAASTKQQMDQHAASTKQQMDQLEIRLDQKLDSHAASLRHDFEQLETRLDQKLDQHVKGTNIAIENSAALLSSNFRGDLNAGLHDVTVRLGALFLGTIFTGLGLAFTAVQFG